MDLLSRFRNLDIIEPEKTCFFESNAIVSSIPTKSLKDDVISQSISFAPNSGCVLSSNGDNDCVLYTPTGRHINFNPEYNFYAELVKSDSEGGDGDGFFYIKALHKDKPDVFPTPMLNNYMTLKYLNENNRWLFYVDSDDLNHIYNKLIIAATKKLINSAKISTNSNQNNEYMVIVYEEADDLSGTFVFNHMYPRFLKNL